MLTIKAAASDDTLTRRTRLPALTGVRIFAALHIYLFHLKQAHDARLLRFSVFDVLPPPVANLIARGHVSTGFFFLLSGFLLAYAYLDAFGRPKLPDRGFWRGRFVRLYPLYFLSLLLLIPAPALLPITAKHPTGLEIAGGVATNLTLTQAWFPVFAIWWNAPAWALSAFAAFYLAFPIFARRIAGVSRDMLVRLVVVLVGISWLPALLFVALDPESNAWTATSITLGGPWLNALRFNPLVWLPQFLAGVAAGRLFARDVDEGRIGIAPRYTLALGDVAALIVVFVLASVPRIPYVLLRHGMMAPFFLLILRDLARGRGILATFFARPVFGSLSEASFGLFALQMPAGVWFSIAMLSSPVGSTLHLLGMITWTLGLAVVWARFCQPRIMRWFSDHRGTSPHSSRILMGTDLDANPSPERPARTSRVANGRRFRRVARDGTNPVAR